MNDVMTDNKLLPIYRIYHFRKFVKDYFCRIPCSRSILDTASEELSKYSP